MANTREFGPLAIALMFYELYRQKPNIKPRQGIRRAKICGTRELYGADSKYRGLKRTIGA